MKSAARSLTDWPGFMNSALPRMVQPVSSEARFELDERRAADRGGHAVGERQDRSPCRVRTRRTSDDTLMTGSACRKRRTSRFGTPLNVDLTASMHPAPVIRGQRPGLGLAPSRDKYNEHVTLRPGHGRARRHCLPVSSAFADGLYGGSVKDGPVVMSSPGHCYIRGDVGYSWSRDPDVTVHRRRTRSSALSSPIASRGTGLDNSWLVGAASAAARDRAASAAS